MSSEVASHSGPRSSLWAPRHMKQMAAFFGTGAVTVLTSIVARRAVATKAFRPNMFQSNFRPPTFSFVHDAVQAVGYSSAISVSTFATGLAGVCWVMDIASISEFGRAMKKKLGGDVHEQKIAAMPMDPEIAEVQKSLSDALK